MIPAEHVGTPKDPRPRPLTPMRLGRMSRRHDSAEAHFAARERYQREHGPKARRERAAWRRECPVAPSGFVYSEVCREIYEAKRAADADWQRLVVGPFGRKGEV
jgi:hypothetical protein